MPDMGQKMIATVQPHVPEPVIAVGVLQPAGTWGAMGGDQLSGQLRAHSAGMEDSDSQVPVLWESGQWSPR